MTSSTTTRSDVVSSKEPDVSQPEEEELLNRAIHPDSKYETPPTWLQSILGKLYILLVFVAALVDLVLFLIPLKIVGIVTTSRQPEAWVESMFFAMMSGLLEVIAGMRMIITTEADAKLDLKSMHRVLLLANHRTEVDWVFFWNFAMRFGFHDRVRVMLKATARYVPGPGWAMLALDFPFVNRNWASDQGKIRDQIKRYRRVEDPSTWLALFPEGTTLCDSTMKRSQEYARSAGATEWSYVLFPRVRGLELCINEHDPEYVLDLTMGYPELRDGVRPTPLRLFQGQIPREVHIHVRCFKQDEMRKHHGHTKQWVLERFAEKEEMLKRFYEEGSFSGKTPFVGPENPRVVTRTIVGVGFHVAVIAFMGYMWCTLPFQYMSTWFILSISFALYQVYTF